ncbi:MAG: helix-turn-helix domain-containing protein [Gemmatimonadota bacterium]
MYDKKSGGGVSAPISTQIRELRLQSGLTLAEVAERAGTSTPTMHRYETGWDRFELSTLRRVAAALGADVEVCLVRRSAPITPAPTTSALISIVESVFWDSELKSSDLERYPGWVLERVLVFGNREQVAAARSYFGDSAITAAIDRRGVDARTRNYWRLVLGESCIPAS